MQLIILIKKKSLDNNINCYIKSIYLQAIIKYVKSNAKFL